MTLSIDDKIRYLVGDEANVHGIYEDTNHIATYGIGIVISERYHWPSFLIRAAENNQEWTQKFITKSGQKKDKKGNVIKVGQSRLMSGSFFSLEANDSEITGELKNKAISMAQDYIANHWNKKQFSENSKSEQIRISSEANKAVNDEVSILSKDPVQLAKDKIGSYERIVSYAAKQIGATLNDGQYLALLSICWNSKRDAKKIIEDTLSKYVSINGEVVAPVLYGSQCSSAKADQIVEQSYNIWSQDVRTAAKPNPKNVKPVFERREKNANDFIKNTPLLDKHDINENNLLNVLLSYDGNQRPS